jgi:DNA-binding response OmpR family regulator
VELKRVEHLVTRNGNPVSLTTREFALLEYLMLHRGRAVSRSTLLREVWNLNTETSTNVVDVYINYLRRKLEDGSQTGDREAEEGAGPATRMIRTVRGVGYMVGAEA